MRTRPALVAALIAALATTASARVGQVALKKPKRGFQMAVSPYTIPAGEDLEWCEYRRLPNKKELFIAGFDLRMPEGAHHFVVWQYTGQTTDDAKFPTEPVRSPGCVGLPPGDDIFPVNLFGMQTPNGRVRFPKGIAVRMKPHQQVWLNPHLKNFGTDDLVPEIKFNMVPAKKGSVKHIAENFVIGNMNGIDVPANGTQTLVTEWTAGANFNLIQLSSHQHQWGTYVDIEIEQDDGGFLKVFEATSWEHPPELWTHETPPWSYEAPAVIRLQQGRRLRFTCKWDNRTAERVRFGVKTTNEMCFVTGYFYRDADQPAGPIPGPGCLPGVQEGVTCFATTVSSGP